MTSSISSIPIVIPSVYAIKHGVTRPTYPVRPEQIMAASFKHITTYPSKDGIGSLDVFKLRILDSLIEKLGVETSGGADLLRISKNNIDSILTNLKAEINAQNVIKSASFGGSQPGTGIFLDLFA